MEEQYKGWMVSTSFIKRCLAVVGHMFVGQLIIAIPFYVVIFGLLFLFGAFN